jgi:hypothetical protein
LRTCLSWLRPSPQVSSGWDKVVELTRLATPETEGRLIRWARGVSCGAIRRKGDLASRPCIREVREAEEARFASWWSFDEGRRFGLEAELPAAQGAVLAQALDRLAEQLPVMPDERDEYFAAARRADALVALASARIGGDPDPDRATVVVHAPLEALISGREGCEVEGGGVIHPVTARRLLCQGRVQVVVEDQGGQPVHLGRITREPPPGCCASSGTGTGSVGSPGAGLAGSPRPTTWCSGSTAAAPTCATSS